MDQQAHIAIAAAIIAAFTLGIIAAGGLYRTTALNHSAGYFVVTNSITGSVWICSGSCRRVTYLPASP